MSRIERQSERSWTRACSAPGAPKVMHPQTILMFVFGVMLVLYDIVEEVGRSEVK